jgi:RNA ligase
MKINLDILNKYIEDGWVNKTNHPTLPISIYNYGPKTQYEQNWDEITIMCRGLVLDADGNVIAKPFPKFRNFEEHKLEEIPNESFEVYEKYDGSLGIVFFYHGEWHVATRGSFTSEQAVKGKEFLSRSSILKNYPTTGLNKNWTYLYEIIFNENRIVVQYPFEGLVLLGIYDNETGNEIEWGEIEKLGNLYDGLKIARKYNAISDYSVLGNMITDDREGYVIRFKSGFRIKIKGDEYKRLHRILTNISSRDIWDYLSNDKPFDEILERVPDEFYNWVKETAGDLQMRFDNIERDYLMIFNDLNTKYTTRKDFALEAIHYPHSSILFSMLNKNDYKPLIWRVLYPKYVKPFKKEV